MSEVSWFDKVKELTRRKSTEFMEDSTMYENLRLLSKKRSLEAC